MKTRILLAILTATVLASCATETKTLPDGTVITTKKIDSEGLRAGTESAKGVVEVISYFK